MPLIIDSSLQLANIENSAVFLGKGADKIDFTVPLALKDNSFTSKASLVQLINTWIRKTSEQSSIYTTIKSEEDALAFTREAPGNCIALMSAKQNRKIFGWGNADITGMVTRKAVERLEEILPKISAEGEKLFPGKPGAVRVVCYDHSALKKYQFSEWFYQDGNFLKEADIRKFYNAAIRHLLKPHKKSLETKALSENTAKSVTAILKELFENTDKHGRKGFGASANVDLLPNMRGVFMEIHKGKKREFLKKTQSEHPFFVYFNHPELFAGEEELKTFLEISVLDSGAGFVQRRSGLTLASLNKNAELDILKECLTQHERGASKLGLTRISKILSENKGFFRLRTGRLCIYRDYLSFKLNKNYNEFESQESERYYAEYNYYDWEKGDKGIGDFPEVSGSLISIFYPLD